MRESRIENYLHEEVVRAGGTTRKHKGRKNDPDRIVIWPRALTIKSYRESMLLERLVNATIHFVETKAPTKTARAGQVREHNRLRKFGCLVLVINTKGAVDEYVAINRP